MKRAVLAVLFAATVAAPAVAQQAFTTKFRAAGAEVKPSGTCTPNGSFIQHLRTGYVYVCANGSWAPVAPITGADLTAYTTTAHLQDNTVGLAPSLLTSPIGTCTGTAGDTPLTASAIPSDTFVAHTGSGLCYDAITTSSSFYAGPAIATQGRVVARFWKKGGQFFGYTSTGAGGKLVMDWDNVGPNFYGLDGNAAYASSLVASVGYNSGDALVGGSGIYGAVTLNARSAIAFQGETADTNMTYLYAVDPTATRLVQLPNATGTLALTSQLTDVTGGTVALVGSSLTAGVAATNDPIAISAVSKGDNSYLGTITSADLTAARTWTFPNASGTVSFAQPTDPATVSAKTSAYPVIAGDSGTIFTNTGAGDTVAFTLPNDPAAGLGYSMVVTAAFTLTVAANTGESLYLSGTTGTCSLITANAVGSAASIIAVVGGAGGIWVASGGGFTCTP